MIKTEPTVSMTDKYELREAAKVLEVSSSSITNWTKKGLIRAGRKRINGRRYWTGAELLKAWRASM